MSPRRELVIAAFALALALALALAPRAAGYPVVELPSTDADLALQSTTNVKHGAGVAVHVSVPGTAIVELRASGSTPFNVFLMSERGFARYKASALTWDEFDLQLLAARVTQYTEASRFFAKPVMGGSAARQVLVVDYGTAFASHIVSNTANNNDLALIYNITYFQGPGQVFTTQLLPQQCGFARLRAQTAVSGVVPRFHYMLLGPNVAYTLTTHLTGCSGATTNPADVNVGCQVRVLVMTQALFNSKFNDKPAFPFPIATADAANIQEHAYGLNAPQPVSIAASPMTRVLYLYRQQAPPSPSRLDAMLSYQLVATGQQCPPPPIVCVAGRNDCPCVEGNHCQLPGATCSTSTRTCRCQTGGLFCDCVGGSSCVGGNLACGGLGKCCVAGSLDCGCNSDNLCVEANTACKNSTTAGGKMLCETCPQGTSGCQCTNTMTCAAATDSCQQGLCKVKPPPTPAPTTAAPTLAPCTPGAMNCMCVLGPDGTGQCLGQLTCQPPGKCLPNTPPPTTSAPTTTTTTGTIATTTAAPLGGIIPANILGAPLYGGVAGVALLLLIGCVCCCCYYYRQSAKKKKLMAMKAQEERRRIAMKKTGGADSRKSYRTSYHRGASRRHLRGGDDGPSARRSRSNTRRSTRNPATSTTGTSTSTTNTNTNTKNEWEDIATVQGPNLLQEGSQAATHYLNVPNVYGKAPASPGRSGGTMPAGSMGTMTAMNTMRAQPQYTPGPGVPPAAGGGGGGGGGGQQYEALPAHAGGTTPLDMVPKQSSVNYNALP